MSRINRLLTDDNATRYGPDWLSAANTSEGLYFVARGPGEHSALLERIEAVAGQLNDDYHLAWARFHKAPPGTKAAVRDLARDRGDRYLEAGATISLAYDCAEDAPAAADPLLLDAQALAASSHNQYMRDTARMAQAEAAAARGHLARSIELALPVLQNGSSASWHDAVRMPGAELRGASGAGRGHPPPRCRRRRPIAAQGPRRGAMDRRRSAPDATA